MNKKEVNSNLKKKNKLKKVLLIILLVIVLAVISFFTFRFIRNKIYEANAKKFSVIINEVSKERTDYVFVEINPSFVLTVEDSKVSDIACLNDDCISIYNDIDVKGKNLDNSIDVIYNVSKEKGFDTSNGIKLSSTNAVTIKSSNNITIEYIDTSKEKELLNEVKNNEIVKEISNDNYYTRLWNELKKDSSYGKVYTCNMNDNKELECYITLETGINDDSDYNYIDRIQDKLSDSATSVMNTLKKFNYNINDSKVTINNIEFNFLPLFTHNGTKYRNVLVSEIIDKLDDKICERGYADYLDGKCEVMNGVYIISLDKLNLVKTNILSENIIEIKLGITENIIKRYDIIWGIEKEKKEREAYIKKCIPIIESKGFTCCDDSGNNCSSCSAKDIETLENSLYCRVTNTITDSYGVHEETECTRINQTFEQYCK